MNEVGTLVNKKETITDNLSSAQYIHIFEQCLYKAIAPIADSAGAFTTQWAFDMLATIGSAPHKRAFSVQISPEEVSILLGNIITCPANMRLHYIRKCMLDRAYLVAMLNRFLFIAGKYLPEKDPALLTSARNLERDAALQLLGMRSWEVEPAINVVRFYGELARTFVSHIAEKYLRLILMRTKAMMQNSMNISATDLYNNNVLTAIRAIYKYSANKGTLTNFLILWMRSNNNPRYGHEVNTAYSLPQGKRRELTNNNWEDKSGAVTNIASNIDEALEVPAEVDNEVDQDDLLYRSTAMLRDYPAVVAYSIMHAFPDNVYNLTDYAKLERQTVKDCIVYEDDLATLSGREPQDLSFDW